jgi:hypothetical protein
VEEAALRALGRRLRGEQQALEVYRALERAGVSVLLVKGAALQALLYAPGDVRAYVDIDVLVDPRRWNRAVRVLRDLGYRPAPSGGVHEHPVHSVAFAPLSEGPDDGGLEVDLHHRLHGTRVSSRRAWQLISRDAVEVRVAGSMLRTTGPAVTLYHLTVSALPEVLGGERHAREWRMFVDRFPGAVPAARPVAGAFRAENVFDRAMAHLNGGSVGSVGPAPLPNRLPGLLLSAWVVRARRSPSWRARGRLVYEVLGHWVARRTARGRSSSVCADRGARL